MKHSFGVWLGVLFFSFLFLNPVQAKDQLQQGSDCDSIKNGDRRNLCLATSKTNLHGEKDVNRYRKKDHSSYYCTLIRSRDLQNLCQAVIDSDQGKCDLIGSRDIEKECKSHF
ncbi:MAG: hypothetical protein ACE5E9_13375 [Nitrospinaceae bacterium]